MIAQLSISWFKSIRELQIDCRRVNVFIGEPNTGKSNILEVLGIFSWAARPNIALREFVRFSHVQNLFFDHLTDREVRIESQGESRGSIVVRLTGGRFVFEGSGGWKTELGHDGRFPSVRPPSPWTGGPSVMFYRYRRLEKYDSPEPAPLIPPDGPNLFSTIYGSATLRARLADLFKPHGLEVVLESGERTIRIVKRDQGVYIAFPFSLSSETLQRIMFHLAAMESNRGATLAFEEPEAHAFPYYTQYLGEHIANDTANQYFIATHNPYLLNGILEKTNKDDIAVFATTYRNHETRVHPLTTSQLRRLMDADPFLGLENVLEADE